MLKSIENTILDGDFEKAVEYYAGLLDEEPSNRSITGGYYAARYWANRSDLIDMERPGKHRAQFLMNEWDQFERELGRRQLRDLAVIVIFMRYIFGLAAQNLRTAFQHEGSKSVGIDLLNKLGLCLLRCEDFTNAVEILEYGRYEYGETPYALFLLAECYSRLDRADKAKIYFREALSGDTSDLEISLIHTDYILELYDFVRSERHDKELLYDWMFITGCSRKIFDSFRAVKDEQIEAVFRDIQFLEKELPEKTEGIQNRLKVQLTKKYLYLMDYFDLQNKDASTFSDLAGRLQELDAEVHKSYMDHRPSRF